MGMKTPQEGLVSVLSQFNPWWKNERIPDLPTWRRGVFHDLAQWVENPPALRAVLLSGPRQVGKTTLLLQLIQKLIDSGAPPENILYATFDHPMLKLAGLDAVLEAWREIAPKTEGPEYLFLDEAQFIKDIGTWVKHQTDFSKSRRIVCTGSATPLLQANQESGVGRWHTLQLTTLSFYEYLQIKKVPLPNIPQITSIQDLSRCTQGDFYRMTEGASALIGHFHEYLVRGGFPQTTLVDTITQAQRLLREDIVGKILQRDMTALFGVRRVLELEQLFIYLCMHDGGLQDTSTIAKELGVAKKTVQSFIDLLESTHLIYRLPPYGYGKEVLRARYKIYLSDPAIAPAVLMKGKAILEDAHALSNGVETAVIGQFWAHCASYQARFCYWRNHRHQEVDLVVEINGETIPFEVKYQSQHVKERDVAGLLDLCRQKPAIRHGFVLTKAPQDIGPLPGTPDRCPCLRIPASLFCYWLGSADFSQKNLLGREDPSAQR
jgi:predicted AAA+ superfamily ATPase